MGFIVLILSPDADLVIRGRPFGKHEEVRSRCFRLGILDSDVFVICRPAHQPRRSSDTRYDAHELRNACLLINTAEYCQVTASEVCWIFTLLSSPSLIRMLTARGKDQRQDRCRVQRKPVFPDRAGLLHWVPNNCNSIVTEVNVILYSVIASAILVQLRELEAAVEPSFDIMMKTSWAAIENVSGPSQYVGDVVASIEAIANIINPLVEQKKYLRNFYDKAAA